MWSRGWGGADYVRRFGDSLGSVSAISNYERHGIHVRRDGEVFVWFVYFVVEK